jgi:hypothetical protein
LKSINFVGARPLASIGFLLAISVLGSAAQEDRIAGRIDGNRVVILEGNLSPKVGQASDRGALDPSTPITDIRMALKQTAVQSADLEKLLEAQRDPSSPDYHRWLTPEEYAERFGVSLNDLDQLAMWLESEGFSVRQVARAGNWIAFSGSAGQIARTFHTELHRYQADGESHFANATEPWIPEALAGLVSELHGLNDFHPKPPRIRRINPDLTTAAGAHYLAPDDLAEIYDITALYKAGFDGTGQKLAIAGQTDINLADIRGFRAQFGLAAKDPQLVLYGTDPGVSSGDQIEADLDLEWSGAVARNATIVYVYSQDVFESVQYAIDQNLAPVISMSYGECELGAPTSYRSMAQQANAEGMTWMNSSGDGGAAGCDYDVSIALQGPAVTFPADIPEITAVGGTEFDEAGSAGWSSQNSLTWQSVTGYLPEIGWNDTALGGGIWASGGGASVLFAKPWWQAGPGVPSDGARDVPDISLSASGDHDGYIIYASGTLMPVGGTSASSPSFAGIVTLINQYVVTKGTQSKPGLGNINPNLYALAQNTTGVIHDVTAGNNIVPCKSGSTGCKTGSFGYSAGVGYDAVTGLGSVDAYNLAANWASAPTGIGTTLGLSANPTSIAQSATTQLTAEITAVTGSAGPAGSVTFTAGGVTLGSAAAIVSGSTASAVFSVKGTTLAVGGDSISASYAPTGNFSSSTGSTTVTVTGSPAGTTTTVTATPASIAAGGTVQLTATVASASGSAAPTGTVTFSLGNTALGMGTLAASGASSAATATLSVAGSKFATGANNITASYAGAGSFTASASTSVTVTVNASQIPTTSTIAASLGSIAQSASTVLTVTVKAASGTAAPTGTVTFMAGNVSLGMETLAASGANAAASLTVQGASLAVGSDTITANYAPTGNFGASTASTTVTVTGAPVATKTSVAATPAGIATTGTTQLTAMVTPLSGSTAATGIVVFSIGNASLGTATLAASAVLPGAAATATLSVAGSRLTMGANNIVASYTGAGNFTASTSTSITVTLTAPLVTTTASVAASPASIAQSASTVLSVTVTPATGTTAPTGTVLFAAGNVPLGSVTLVASGGAAIATLTVKGSSLGLGSNALSASYSGDSKFAASTGSVVVTVAASPAVTTTVVVASPPTFAQNAATQITAMVKLATGSTLPAGTVSFAIGNTSLGSATLSVSAGMASGSISVAGSKLSLGSNTITASYAGSGSFAASTASVLVVVTAPTVATTTAVTASTASFLQSALTQLTVTVKAATGSVAPTGTVTFSLGPASAPGLVSLGTATLTGSGGVSTATLTVKGSSLAVGSDVIAATYAGAGSFAGSAGSTTVSVTASRTSNVIVAAAKTTSTQSGFPVRIQLQEQNGLATTLTGFSINGTDFTPSIAAFFGTTQMAADGALTGTMVIQWNPLPAVLVFVFTGEDVSGAKWSQTVSLATR